MAALSVASFAKGLTGLGLLSCPWAMSCSNLCEAIRKLSLDKPPIIPPKRPLSAYLRYVMEQQPILINQKPDLTVTERIKYIAQDWRQLTADQKQPYETAANDSRVKYRLEMAAFKAQLTPTQLAVLKEERRYKLAKRRTIRQKRKLTMLGKPKRVRSAFNIFMAEKFEDAKGETSKAKLKNLYDMWRNLSDTQKQMYSQLAEDDKIRYKNEIKSWKEHMIQTGHEDVIHTMKKKERAERSPGVTSKSNQTALQATYTETGSS
ncbi:transcription factor A, mitochondrial isoform X2 [Hypanus sabinus]|uniref:transcription factor A, mitochondrial isoform X2 n=1 Tax=Hypanus sabinus TaxID=79690 RepID=UPI0028C45879|nr:transcription factor A, mitochondrial isoform X2 [Hypanus sabinus]